MGESGFLALTLADGRREHIRLRPNPDEDPSRRREGFEIRPGGDGYALEVVECFSNGHREHYRVVTESPDMLLATLVSAGSGEGCFWVRNLRRG